MAKYRPQVNKICVYEYFIHPVQWLYINILFLKIESDDDGKMQSATDLFHCIESGSGWAGCAQYCTPDATFDCQAGYFFR